MRGLINVLGRGITKHERAGRNLAKCEVASQRGARIPARVGENTAVASAQAPHSRRCSLAINRPE